MPRTAIFGPKDGPVVSYRVRAMTKKGHHLFEAARKRLKKLAGWEGDVSDCDTAEFLVRGEEQTLKELKK